MFSSPDFAQKQVIFVLCNEGEKLAFSNDNLVVKDSEGNVKLQCTCYRLFMVFAVGHISVTSALIQKAQKFGFFIALMTPGFRLYSIIGACKDGNTLLHRRQYAYSGLGIAKVITANKMTNQLCELKTIRSKNGYTVDAIASIKGYIEKLTGVSTLNELMAYEGLASKLYFRCHFDNVDWQGRQPRIKRDYVNSALDIGYTLLFTFIDALLSCFGFDTYCGVMHTQFYMRKSLVCDIVEPFRPIIDHALKKAINLGQVQEDDFINMNGRFNLKWENSAKYVQIFMAPLIERKQQLFEYVQAYYRAFMKQAPESEFPRYDMGGTK